MALFFFNPQTTFRHLFLEVLDDEFLTFGAPVVVFPFGTEVNTMVVFLPVLRLATQAGELNHESHYCPLNQSQSLSRAVGLSVRLRK